MGELLRFLVLRKDKPDSAGIKWDRKVWSLIIIPAIGLPVALLFIKYGNPYSSVFYSFSIALFVIGGMSLAIFPPMRITGLGVLIPGAAFLIISFIYHPGITQGSISCAGARYYSAGTFIWFLIIFLVLDKLQILPGLLSLMIMITMSIFWFVDHNIALYIPLITGILAIIALVGYHNDSIRSFGAVILVPCVFILPHLLGPLPFYSRAGHIALGSIPCILYIFAYHYLVRLFRGSASTDSPMVDVIVTSRLRKLGLDKNSFRLFFIILAGIGAVINYIIQVLSWSYLSIAVLLTSVIVLFMISIFNKSSKIISKAFTAPVVSEIVKQRQFARIASKDIITFSFNTDEKQWKSGFSIDFTPWGMTLSLPETVSEGDLIYINYTIPETSQPIPLIGEVVWAVANDSIDLIDVNAGIRIISMDAVNGSFPLIEHYFAKLRTLSTWDEKILQKVDPADYVAV